MKYNNSEIDEIEKALDVLQSHLYSEDFIWVISKETSIIYHKDKLPEDIMYLE